MNLVKYFKSGLSVLSEIPQQGESQDLHPEEILLDDYVWNVKRHKIQNFGSFGGTSNCFDNLVIFCF